MQLITDISAAVLKIIIKQIQRQSVVADYGNERQFFVRRHKQTNLLEQIIKKTVSLVFTLHY